MMSQFTNFGENKLIDKVRAQVPPYPATYWFVAFGSAADDGSFTEITGARSASARANWPSCRVNVPAANERMKGRGARGAHAMPACAPDHAASRARPATHAP